MKWTTLFIVAAGLTLPVADEAPKSLYDIPLKTLDGRDTSLEAYKGKVLLIVNVASRCGYTPQYEGLQSLHEKFGKDGLVVLGFPCNQFGAQEPGTPEQIASFCKENYGVTFPMFEKVEVKGSGQHALYKMLSGPGSPFPGDVKWNFGKFLIGRDGTIVKRFESRDRPEGREVVEAVETALKG